jgi:hypothetical protein
MKYASLYRDQQEIVKSSSKGRRMLKQIFGKKPVSFPKYVNTINHLSNDNSSGGRNHRKLLCEELQWRKDGSPVIFIETQELAIDLYEAKFNFEEDFNVAPPFKSFSMTFPQDTLVNGINLNSALVTIMTRKDFMGLYGTTVITLEDILSYEYDENELGICVNYESVNGVVDTNFTQISSLTKTLKRNSKNPLPNNGTNILEALTKIALALCVYHSATDGEKLVKGYPMSSISIPKGKTRGSYTALTIRSFRQRNSTSSGRKVTHRIPHFRNLRAEKYYQGEYKDMKPGTRWTFVKEVDVNDSMNTLLN